MVIFHGSNIIVDKPSYGVGRPDNDYGSGFYCTEDIELAGEWAATGIAGGFVNEYELDTDSLNIFYLNNGDYHILNWLALLMNNRVVRVTSPVEKRGLEYVITHFLPDIENVDVIVGYRADDSYFSFSRAFLSNSITLQQLSHAMKYGDLGLQVMLRSKRAFSSISFTCSYPVDGNEYYPKRMARDRAARTAFQELLEKEDRTGLYLSDIMRKEISDDDSGIFKIISG